MTFEPKIDSSSKEIQIIPQSMVFTVPTDGKDSQEGDAVSKKPLDPSDVSAAITLINGTLNHFLEADPTGKLILDHATSIKIENSQLVIEAQ